MVAALLVSVVMQHRPVYGLDISSQIIWFIPEAPLRTSIVMPLSLEIGAGHGIT